MPRFRAMVVAFGVVVLSLLITTPRASAAQITGGSTSSPRAFCQLFAPSWPITAGQTGNYRYRCHGNAGAPAWWNARVTDGYLDSLSDFDAGAWTFYSLTAGGTPSAYVSIGNNSSGASIRSNSISFTRVDAYTVEWVVNSATVYTTLPVGPTSTTWYNHTSFWEGLNACSTSGTCQLAWDSASDAPLAAIGSGTKYTLSYVTDGSLNPDPCATVNLELRTYDVLVTPTTNLTSYSQLAWSISWASPGAGVQKPVLKWRPHNNYAWLNLLDTNTATSPWSSTTNWSYGQRSADQIAVQCTSAAGSTIRYVGFGGWTQQVYLGPSQCDSARLVWPTSVSNSTANVQFLPGANSTSSVFVQSIQWFDGGGNTADPLQWQTLYTGTVSSPPLTSTTYSVPVEWASTARFRCVTVGGFTREWVWGTGAPDPGVTGLPSLDFASCFSFPGMELTSPASWLRGLGEMGTCLIVPPDGHISQVYEAVMSSFNDSMLSLPVDVLAQFSSFISATQTAIASPTCDGPTFNLTFTDTPAGQSVFRPFSTCAGQPLAAAQPWIFALMSLLIVVGGAAALYRIYSGPTSSAQPEQLKLF